MKVTTIDLIQSTKNYINYLETHLNNIVLSYIYLSEICSDFDVIKDKKLRKSLKDSVMIHDLSKLSKDEFCQYRQFWHTSKNEEKNKDEFQKAWGNHKEKNHHHWEYIKKYNVFLDDEAKLNLFHMIIDWTAMSMYYGDSPSEYYKKMRKQIDFPKEHEDYIVEIMQRINDNNKYNFKSK